MGFLVLVTLDLPSFREDRDGVGYSDCSGSVWQTTDHSALRLFPLWKWPSPRPEREGEQLFVWGGETEPLYPTGTDAVIYYAVPCCVRAC